MATEQGEAMNHELATDTLAEAASLIAQVRVLAWEMADTQRAMLDAARDKIRTVNEIISKE